MPNLVRRLLDRQLAASTPADVPPLPARGDHVEAWLKTHRDRFREQTDDWFHIDVLLDEYRLHADTGTPLHEHACSGSFCEHDEDDDGLPYGRAPRGTAAARAAIAQARGDEEPPPSTYGYA